MSFLKKLLAILAAVLLLGAAGIAAAAWWVSESALNRAYRVESAPLPAPTRGAVPRGAHLFATRGCSDCHGDAGQGRELLDEAPLYVAGTNLTPAGVGRFYSPETMARAIRHGIGFDDRALIFMPSHDYAEMSDADVVDLIAYLRQLPAAEDEPAPTRFKPLGRVLYTFGQLPVLAAEHIDHSPRERSAPPVGATVEYGAYLALTCHGCHGADYAGQRVPATPPSLPPASDLRAQALSHWGEADFVRAIREGKRPDGSDLHPLMPWQSFSGMTDVELGALWAFFSSLGVEGDGSAEG